MWMPHIDPARRREYARSWYHRTKKQTRARRAAARRRNSERVRAWFRQFKRGLRCSRCGESHPACLSFHHRDRALKKFDVSYAAAHGYSVAAIEAEIAKCIVLCVNCHLLAHAGSS